MNINISDFALIIPIDKNKIVYGEYRYYEFEAVRLLKSFRKNAGIFKNINIYIFKNKNIDISKNTINEINKMHNVFLFEDEVKNPNKYKFINIPIQTKFRRRECRKYLRLYSRGHNVSMLFRSGTSLPLYITMGWI